MTNIGKPYEGKPHVRFDEEGLGSAQPFTLELGVERWWVGGEWAAVGR